MISLSRYQTLCSMLSAMLEHTSDQPIITQHSIEDAKQSSVEPQQKCNASILLVEDVLPNQLIAK